MLLNLADVRIACQKYKCLGPTPGYFGLGGLTWGLDLFAFSIFPDDSDAQPHLGEPIYQCRHLSHHGKGTQVGSCLSPLSLFLSPPVPLFPSSSPLALQGLDGLVVSQWHSEYHGPTFPEAVESSRGLGSRMPGFLPPSDSLVAPG